MGRITVILAEQEDVVRHGIRRILESDPDLEVVSEVSDTVSAVAEAERHHPEVAVIAAGLPEGGGIAAAARIRRVAKETRLLLLAWQPEEDRVRMGSAAGGYAFLPKTCSDRELIAAVREMGAKKKGSGFSGSIHGAAPGQPGESPVDDLDLLTARERQVLVLIAQGKTNKEIGEVLGISANTADSHRKHIMEKLGIHSKTELVRFALLRGLG